MSETYTRWDASEHLNTDEDIALHSVRRANWQSLPIMPILAKEASEMATMNVSLPDPMKTWVESRVKTGQHSNASDYVRDLIRRDQERHDKRKTLIRALEAGEASGTSARSLDDIWHGVKERHGIDV